jgi:type III restriction enzyme
MSDYPEVKEPIINSPFEKPKQFWFIQEGEEPQLLDGRRPAIVFPPRDQKVSWTTDSKTLRASKR